MTILLFLLIPLGIFVVASKAYGGWLARQLGENASAPTPAHQVNDGRDFVPTRPYVLFAHHFSAIAGAGPILGPTMAILYGVGPVWLWVVLGGVFFGAVHDYTALFVSMREGGKSVAQVARKTMGIAGFNLFIFYTIVMLALVTAAFLNATAMSLTSLWPLEKIGVQEGETFLKTMTKDGVVMGKIGGIASMSVIIITLLSPLLGWLYYIRKAPAGLMYALAAVICVGSVVAGIVWPVMLSAQAWMVVVSIYVFIAAGVPVWVILQPRDFINVQILYGGMILMLLSLISVGVQGHSLSMSLFSAESLREGTAKMGMIWPMMFITVACGAISGFHALVSGGTTVKQLATESDARCIGYNAMLMESFLAVCVLLALAIGLSAEDYRSIVWPAAASGVKPNPILGFSLAAGHLFNKGLGIPVALGTVFGILMVEGFVVTTLDAAVRLNRYLFEELWAIALPRTPRLMAHYWFNAGLAVAIMWVLAYTNAFNALWLIFGAANQMLAALALIAVTLWLLARRQKYFFAIVPAVFMIVTTFYALARILLPQYVTQGKTPLAIAAVVLIILSIAVVALVVLRVIRPQPVAAPADGGAGVNLKKGC